MSERGDLCPVWVSRRLWPWPKRYVCKWFGWGGGDGRYYSNTVLMLVLADDSKLFIDCTGRTIQIGRKAHEWEVERLRQETGQNIPVKGAA